MKIKTFKMLLVVATVILVGVIVFDGWRNLEGGLNTKKSTPTTTIKAYIKPTTSAKPISQTILLNVPFTPQAPFGNWDDDRQQDGCEEASALMAIRWARGQSLTRAEAEKEILAISDFELEKYGSYHDTDAEDTVKRIFNDYFKYNNVEAKFNINANDIKAELAQGNLIIVPANGIKLNNPNFTPPGPTHHMLVVRGYDPKTDEFITNDPGTRLGELYRYSSRVLMDAIYNYKTGHNVPVSTIVKAMVVVRLS